MYSVNVYWAPTICQALWNCTCYLGLGESIMKILENFLDPYTWRNESVLDLVQHELSPLWASNLKNEVKQIHTICFLFSARMDKEMPSLHSCYLAWLLLWRLSVRTKWTRSRVGDGLTILLPIIVGTLLNEVGFYKLFEM